MPKIPRSPWTEHTGGPHPVTGQNDGPYAKIPLGDLVGLTQFGVHLERLPPGSRSSHRHWHEEEDEFIYVLSGELVLIEETGTVLRPGDAAGWAHGHPTAHCLENRSDQDAVILVVGTRLTDDIVHYPDNDLTLHRKDGRRSYTRTDGTPFKEQ